MWHLRSPTGDGVRWESNQLTGVHSHMVWSISGVLVIKCCSFHGVSKLDMVETDIMTPVHSACELWHQLHQQMVVEVSWQASKHHPKASWAMSHSKIQLSADLKPCCLACPALSGKGSPPENAKRGQLHHLCCKWGGSACENGSNLPSWKICRIVSHGYLQRFWARKSGNLYSEYSQIMDKFEWKLAPTPFKRWPKHWKVRPHAGLQSSENRPESITVQQGPPWPQGKLGQMSNAKLRKTI